MRMCMDWRSVRFDWNHARAFLIAAEEGSFSAAARALAMSQPTVGRQVAALEEELGVVLFERAGRRLQLTDAGIELLALVRAMGRAAMDVSLRAERQGQQLEGAVCITASDMSTAYELPPLIPHLRRTHPGITVELVSSDSASDLRRREADIAIRNFRPQQPDLFTRRIGDRHGRMYATPEYLAQIGNPTTAEELSQAEFFGFDRTNALIEYLHGYGLSLTQANFPVISHSQLVQWELAKAGAGIAIVMDRIGDAETRVRRVLPDFPSIDAPVWLTCHRELHTSRRIRTVFDWLAAALAD